MRKLFFLALLAGAVALTGTAGLIYGKAKDLVLGAVPTGQRAAWLLDDLRGQYRETVKQRHEYLAKRFAEEAEKNRAVEKKEDLDRACGRLAALINGSDTGGTDAAVDRYPARARDDGNLLATSPPAPRRPEPSPPSTILWGRHRLSREQAREVLVGWGREADDWGIRIAASDRKIQAYDAGIASLERGALDLKRSISDLEVKLEELATRRDVLGVQRQVAEIDATVRGREDVVGKAAELVNDVQAECDRLEGEIAAWQYGGTADPVVHPQDDLRDDSDTAILTRYGVEIDPNPAVR